MSSPWQVIPWSSHTGRPWKNGGGATTELAAWPDGAGLDDFEWRVSVADVASDGPFSHFPGRDRTLFLIDGAGLELSIGGAVLTLDLSQRRAAFPGDAPTHGRLLAGPIRDLNVMTRRDGWRHDATLLGSGAWKTKAPVWLLVCLAADGGVASLEGQAVALARLDVILGHGGLEDASADHQCCLIQLWPHPRP
ncbi:MAG: hypothetical protein ABS75_32405 [Pelagibacterium sp. SCN 63-23]|nr:MAG: hypothetical protein ABS75_32405 [Pelagibacterium sp. SCN 63-23]